MSNHETSSDNLNINSDDSNPYPSSPWTTPTPSSPFSPGHLQQSPPDTPPDPSPPSSVILRYNQQQLYSLYSLSPTSQNENTSPGDLPPSPLQSFPSDSLDSFFNSMENDENNATLKVENIPEKEPSHFSQGKQNDKVTVKQHRHAGVFIARAKKDALVTKNMVMGESVYGEKRISVEDENGKIEYRVWNPFRSKLAAAIMCGLDQIHMPPGSKVLYLGAANGTTVSHVSDVVGPKGMVYAVEFSHRSGRNLLNVAQKRTNVVPIIEDARHPHKYRILVPMVDCIFADMAQPDQAKIVANNAQYYLKNGGNFVISINAKYIDSTAETEDVFSGELKKMMADKMKATEQVTLEPYERDHTVVVGIYRAPPKVNVAQDKLPQFLKTAERLKVKGLAEAPQSVKTE